MIFVIRGFAPCEPLGFASKPVAVRWKLMKENHMNAQKPNRKVRKIGADVEDYEIEQPTLVIVQKTLRGRIVDLGWVVTATVIAVTILNALILPLFS